MAFEFPAYGQQRDSNELAKRGVMVSAGGVRSIWLRHDLQSFKKRLSALEAKVARGRRYSERSPAGDYGASQTAKGGAR